MNTTQFLQVAIKFVFSQTSPRGSEEDSRERYDDEEGPVEALVLHEVSDEGDGLNGLPQTHLVGQDAVQVVVVK